MPATGEIDRTLSQLEALALEPSGLGDEETLATLRRLQHRLHRASEDAYALPGRELAVALAAARDATAELVDAAVAEGLDAAALRLHAWRGALHRARLARLRAEGASPPKPARAPERPRLHATSIAVVLALAGAALLAAGAGLDEWPLWAAGILAVCGSLLAYPP